jgi:hypothetical protein
MVTLRKWDLPKAAMLSVVLLLTLTLSSPAFGQATSITSTGYRATEGGGGAITTVYTTGNLGNTWSEGEWVPYQLIINNVQTDFPGLVGLPDIVMEYDFTAQNDARFVDLVRSIQVGTTQLTNAQGWPRDDGSAYPMGTRPNIEDAQNDVGNTGDLENIWTGFTHLNLPNSQVNRDAPPGYGDGTPTDQFRYFYITLQDLIDAGVPTDANTIVVYYQLHESRSFVWFNSLQEQYDADQTDDWGGYVYSLPAFAADSRNGSGYVPGSSGQLRVSFGGGDKTVPIPIPERLPGAVSGLKWRDQNGDGIIDGGEETLSGWRIFVEGTLENINFSTSTLTDEFGNYSFPNLTSNVVWTVYEDVNREVPFEDDFMQTYPMPGTVVGVGTGVALPADPNFGDYGWDVALTEVVSEQADMNFGNKQCELALFCPPNITIDCNDPDGPSFTGPPTWESNCEPVTTDYSDNVIPGDCDVDGYLYIIERTWTATDGLGQTETCTQIITVTDTTPPVITGVGGPETIECPAEPVFSDPTASDDCSDVTLTFDDVTTPGACPEEYSVTRTWTATDECGNSSTDSQTITVEDNTPPVITGVGGGGVIECPAEPVFSDPTATDACDPDPSLTYNDVMTPGSCPQEYSVTRTWTATDACGNSSTASETIFVEDNTPPVITGVGGPETIECPADPVFSNPTASDECDPDPSLTYDDVMTPGSCPQEYSVTRTWTATDACGNSATASQTITVEDNTPPVISGVGPGGSVECPDEPVFSDPTASDECDPDPTLTYDDVMTPGSCPQEYSVTRTWTATDACGNTATASQTINVEDNTPPVITCPVDVDVNCDETVDFGEATAVDECDPEPVIGYTDVVLSETCPQHIERTWTATDACGNSASCVQNIIVRDETPPVISGVGPDDVIECPAEPVFSDPSATDNCDQDPSLTYDDVVTPGSCPQEYSVTRTWTATDFCGNSSSASQTITVVDNTPPVITGVGNDTTFNCTDDPVFSDPTASDACDPDPSLTYTDQMTPGNCPQNYSITRTWTATDACGNSSSASQTVYVVDNTAPTFSGVGNDTTISCDASPVFSNPTISDDCDTDPTLTHVDDSTMGDCPYNYSITRTWTATDDCGNTATASQTITVDDTEAPVLTCAPDATIACEDDLVFTPPTAVDNCDPDPLITEVSFDSTAGPGDGEWTYVMCWIATDTCGNISDQCCQTIIREACPEDGCTFTIGGWGTDCPDPQEGDMYSTQPGCVRDHYFGDVFPGGVVIGHHSGYTATWTSSWAVEYYLPAGGTPAVLTGDLVDPSEMEGNILISQILALTLNREYICAGVFYDLGLWPDMACYGDRIVGECGGGMFDGLTVDEFLEFANKVVSGKTNMLGDYNATLSDVNYTATCLNELYSDCDPFADVVPISSFEVAEDDVQDPNLPTEYDLFQNSPNPFNPVTSIKFSLPEASYVRLSVYNILGQAVADLVDGNLEAGNHTVSWDGHNAASGIYLYRLEVDRRVFTKKMLLMK